MTKRKQYCERCKYFNSEKYCLHPLFEADKPPIVKPRYICLLFKNALDARHSKGRREV